MQDYSPEVTALLQQLVLRLNAACADPEVKRLCNELLAHGHHTAISATSVVLTDVGSNPGEFPRILPCALAATRKAPPFSQPDTDYLSGLGISES